eukprot:3469730-Rhodomonas_salina.1
MEKTWALLHRRFDPIARASAGCPPGPPIREVSARNCVCAIICVTAEPPPPVAAPALATPAPPLAACAAAAAAPVVVPAAAAAPALAVAATVLEATAEAMETATAEPTTTVRLAAVLCACCRVSPIVSFFRAGIGVAGSVGRGIPRKVPLETLAPGKGMRTGTGDHQKAKGAGARVGQKRKRSD